MTTDKERKEAAKAWNSWKPGSGKRKGWSPFSQPTPPAQWFSPEGIPLKPDGTIDMEKFEAMKKGKNKR